MLRQMLCTAGPSREGAIQKSLGETLKSPESMETRAVLSQGWPRDAAVNFGTYRSSQRHPAVFTIRVCDSNAFELNNSINRGKIAVLNISIYSSGENLMQNWKFVALPVPGIIGSSQKICQVPGYTTRPKVSFCYGNILLHLQF